jgi:hypothetical protein
MLLEKVAEGRNQNKHVPKNKILYHQYKYNYIKL